MINLNLNPDANLTIDELQEKKQELIVERHEFIMKENMGMPMSDEELDRYGRIDSFIEQCDYAIDLMTISGETDYEWPVD